MNEQQFDQYVQMIAQQTGLFACDVRKVLEAVNKMNFANPMVDYSLSRGSDDIRCRSGSMVMGQPG